MDDEQRWLREVIGRIDAVAWEADPETFRFRSVSPSAEKLLGYPVTAWLEPGFWERSLHPDDRASAVAECAAAVAQRRDHCLSYRLIARDGSAVWVDDMVAVLPKHGNSAPVSLRGVLVNATGRRREEEHFRFLIESSSDVITILNPDGTIRYTSPAIERILGYDQAELVGEDAFGYVHPDDVLEVRRAFAAATMTAGFTPPVEFRFRHKSGSWRYLESIGRNMIGEPVGAVLVTSRDVTARRHLAELHRMEAVGQLASGVAHDFNNILAVISGHAELMHAEAPPAGDHLVEILRATERGGTLTRRLLDFARHGQRDTGDCTVDLAEAVPQLVALLRPVTGAPVRIDVEIGAGVPPISFERGQLDHVLLNLILNARDAMPAGGRISITATGSDPVLLQVADTGTGIRPEIREQLFEPFFSTKGSAGTGLGLSTVKAMVEAHGGTIRVASEEGAGSTFTLALVPASHSPAEPYACPPAPAVHGTAEVLVVDADRVVRDLIGEAMRRYGYRVHVADDARTALAIADRLDVEILVTGLSLPDARGEDLASRLLARNPDLGIVFTSGTGHEAAPAPTPNTRLLAKPFALQALAAAVAEVGRRHSG